MARLPCPDYVARERAHLDSLPVLSDQRTPQAVSKGTPKVLEKLQKQREAARIESACRIKVRIRDKGHCFFPGCRIRMSEMHHISARSLGGKWVTDNIISACAKHHSWFKAGLIRVSGNPDIGPVRVERTDMGISARIRIPLRVK